MATATEPPAVEAADFVPTPLYPAMPSGAPVKIEVLGATGDYKAGKTIFLLSLAPGSHPPSHPFAGQPRMRLYDFEKSAGSYQGAGCDRVDVPKAVRAATGSNEYSPLQAFEWFVNDVLAIEQHRFDLIGADPITDIESGLVEYVRTNCEKFGLTPTQIQKAGGLFWGQVRDYWKRILLILADRCQTFAFTSHLRMIWQGGTPTTKREPKGKDTLMELASLYLWLERKPDQHGKVPMVPSATVLKERLSDIVVENGRLKVIPLLPPRLPKATIEAICQYISNPPDYGKLKTGERDVPKELSKEDQLGMELAKAEAERDTEESRLAQLAKRAEVLKLQRQAAMQAASPSTDKTAEILKAKQARRDEAAEVAKLEARKQQQAKIERKLMSGHDPGNSRKGMILPNQIARLKELFGSMQALLGLTDKEMIEFIRGKLLAAVNVKQLSDMTWAQADQLVKWLEKKINRGPGKNQSKAVEDIPY